MSSRWSASFSYFATKNHQLINNVVTTPNQNAFNLDQTWTWGSTLSAIYRLPKEIQLAAFMQAKSGTKGERTYVFRNIPNSSTITMRLGERGSLNNPNFKTVNIKLNRRFKIYHGGVDITFDAFNIFNANTATGITKASGTTFGYETGLLAPRVAQLGFRYSF